MSEPRARVYIDGKPYDGRIVSSKPSSTGLVKVTLDGDVSGGGISVARHIDRVEPLNEAARELCKGARYDKGRE